mgnify:CR=1 FL=1
MFTVSPSILSGNLLNLERQLDALAGLGNLHLDIDDGNFAAESALAWTRCGRLWITRTFRRMFTWSVKPL